MKQKIFLKKKEEVEDCCGAHKMHFVCRALEVYLNKGAAWRVDRVAPSQRQYRSRRLYRLWRANSLAPRSSRAALLFHS